MQKLWVVDATKSILCIRTLQGRSLLYPSFVAVVLLIFTDIIYVLHNMRSTYVQNHRRLRMYYVSVTTQFLYSRLIVKTKLKPKISAHIIVHVVSPHLNPRF